MIPQVALIITCITIMVIRLTTHGDSGVKG